MKYILTLPIMLSFLALHAQSDLFRAMNTKYYNYSGNLDTFQIPNQSKIIYVEVWGGGGAGGGDTGGQGGAYVLIEINVDALKTKVLNLSVGQGGFPLTNGNVTNGDGKSSSISFEKVSIIARGGASLNNPLTNGSFSVANGEKELYFSYRGQMGRWGSNSKIIGATLGQGGSYIFTVNGGDGGWSGHSERTGGTGGSLVVKKVSGETPVLISKIDAQNGCFPGGGGGSMPRLNPGIEGNSGAPGANGLVIVHF